MLDIDLEFIRGMLFIRLKGILDHNTYTKLNDCLDRMIHEEKLKYFVINLESLEKVDEYGLQILINRYYDVMLQNGKILLCGYQHFLLENATYQNLFLQIECTNNELSAFNQIRI